MSVHFLIPWYFRCNSDHPYEKKWMIINSFRFEKPRRKIDLLHPNFFSTIFFLVKLDSAR